MKKLSILLLVAWCLPASIRSTNYVVNDPKLGRVEFVTRDRSTLSADEAKTVATIAQLRESGELPFADTPFSTIKNFATDEEANEFEADLSAKEAAFLAVIQAKLATMPPVIKPGAEMPPVISDGGKDVDMPPTV